MKKLISVIICMILALALYGCAGTAANQAAPAGAQETDKAADVQPTEQTTVPEIAESGPNPSQTPEPVPANAEYFIDGSSLVMKTDEGQHAIYDARDQFDAGWACDIELLIVEEDALYLTEAGLPAEEMSEEPLFNIVRLDRSGGSRMVLHTQEYVGLTQMLSYGSRLVFVSDGFDSMNIGWVDKNGGADNWLDVSAYAAENGTEPDYSYAELYIEGENLLADVGFFVLNASGGDEIWDDTIWIKPDMTVESIVD